MKIVGRGKANEVIVALEYREWLAIGGATERDRSGYCQPDLSNPAPDIFELVEALKKIKNAVPDLQRIRATFQSFLMLTEPESVNATLAACGVAEPITGDPPSDAIES
jgi:hypothetical protein